MLLAKKGYNFRWIMRWGHTWVNLLLDKKIILCDVCKKMVPLRDQKTIIREKLFSTVLKKHFQFQQALPKHCISCQNVYLKLLQKIISVRCEKNDLSTKCKGCSIHSFNYIVHFQRIFPKSQQDYLWNFILHNWKLIYRIEKINDKQYLKLAGFFLTIYWL